MARILTSERPLNVNLKITRAYYAKKPLRDCKGGRNFQAQVKNDYPYLDEFLIKLGVDITKPEILAFDKQPDGLLNYFVATYVVSGEIDGSKYSREAFYDRPFVRVIIEKGYPDGEDGVGQFFNITVYGIVLPFVLNEPPPPNEKPPKKLPLPFTRKYRYMKITSVTD